MRRRLVLSLLALGLLVAPASASAKVTPTALTFNVKVGAANDQMCIVDADLYKPADVTAANPAPAVLMTNGFGGNKGDLAAFAQALVARGYVALAYSGLGFGNSGCKISLDAPDPDGKAGKQLVSFLGGSKAATDGTKVNYVVHDPVAHDGTSYPDDPRVGMIGGSYGGQIQYAIAGQDPRVDTIIPIITWNDLAYSLAPNNSDFTSGVTYNTPGTEKQIWTSLFFGVGIMDGIENASVDPMRNVGCPNFDNRACQAKAQMDAVGYPTADTIALARNASVSSYIANIRIPTMLVQGQTDTLFNLNEAVATYNTLRAQNVPVKMVWRDNGHSGGIKTETTLGTPETSPVGRDAVQWFDYYLLGVGDPPALDLSYYRDYVPHGANDDPTPSYQSAPAYPVGTTRHYFLSSSDSLVRTAGEVKAGTASFAAPAHPTVTSYSEISAEDPGTQPPSDAPGSFAGFTSAPLPDAVDVVGIPTADVTLSAPTYAGTQGSDPGGKLVLFFKLYDLDPAGNPTLVRRLIAPVRVADVTKPLHVTLPGIVHRFPAGHRFQLVIAGSDAAYHGNVLAGPVSVVTDPKSPGVLTLPRLGVPDATDLADGSGIAPGKPGTPQVAGSGGPPQAQPAAQLPTSRRCASRRTFVIHLRRAPKGDKVLSATVNVNGKRVKVLRGKRLHAPVSLRGLPAGTVRVSITATTRKHRHLRSVRIYRTCAKKKART